MDDLVQMIEKLKSEVEDMQDNPPATDVHDALTHTRNITKYLNKMLKEENMKFINREEALNAF
jgi:DNA-binding phage protein